MFINMLGDDIVSLTALTLIVDPKCRNDTDNVVITQITLSLYLMAKCQLTLRLLVKSLVHTLDDYIETAQKILLSVDRTLDHFTLKMTKLKILTYIA